MKLTKIQVTNFRCIEDSNIFEIGDLTCLVGKNEAGKTAILKALHGVAPYDSFRYDKTRDYPRRYLTKYNERHPDGESIVVNSWWILNDDDVSSIEDALGNGIIESDEVVVTTTIDMKATWDVKLNETKCIEHLSTKHDLGSVDKEKIVSANTTKEVLEILSGLPERSSGLEAMFAEISSFREGSANLAAIDILSKRRPKFFYTSHFERMSGEISLNKITQDKKKGSLDIGDKIFLDFLEYAGTSIEELCDTKKHEELVAQCEAASNDITDEIFEFWSQNEALSVKIELSEGRPEDPEPYNCGQIVKIRIENKNHRASLPLSERSAGFVWFFSFLSQFKQLKKTAGPAILLLDEPGLTLHGKAQSDLLRYIETRLLPEHQVIYTTHSPFMVPAQRLSDVRIVEDIIDYSEPRRPIVKGTKVSAEILSVDKDTLFPLQAHLGYEITQTLFIGKHCILVEGPSDVVYLHVISQAFTERRKVALDSCWTICPTGGLDKVISFVSLFSGNNLDIAVLCDYGHGDKSKVERLRQSQILKTGRVLTAADFTEKTESDIEDLFNENLYCRMINKALNLSGKNAISTERLLAAEEKSVRLVKKVEAWLRTIPADCPDFDHYTPADWLLRHPDVLDGDDPEVLQTLAKFETIFKCLNEFLR